MTISGIWAKAGRSLTSMVLGQDRPFLVIECCDVFLILVSGSKSIHHFPLSIVYLRAHMPGSYKSQRVRNLRAACRWSMSMIGYMVIVMLHGGTQSGAGHQTTLETSMRFTLRFA